MYNNRNCRYTRTASYTAALPKFMMKILASTASSHVCGSCPKQSLVYRHSAAGTLLRVFWLLRLLGTPFSHCCLLPSPLLFLKNQAIRFNLVDLQHLVRTPRYADGQASLGV